MTDILRVVGPYTLRIGDCVRSDRGEVHTVLSIERKASVGGVPCRWCLTLRRGAKAGERCMRWVWGGA